MPQLADKIFNKIEAFQLQAEQLIENEQFSAAIKEYQKAWNTLPEPKQLWDAALWIKVGQAECLLATESYAQAKKILLEAILCSGAVSNPLVHLLLGISYFESNELQSAQTELQIAYDLEGIDIFQDDDQKYKQFLFNKPQ